MVRRYVLTGAPGSGKTVLLEALRERGHAVVEEAATDVIARQQARGVDEPWEQADFLDLVAGLQRERLREPLPESCELQFHDRSPLCTVALARFLGRPVTAALAAEVDRVIQESTFAPTVFLVRPLGFIEHTAARRVDYEQALEFGEVHVEVYREHGFDIVGVPAADPPTRAATVIAHVGSELGRPLT